MIALLCSSELRYQAGRGDGRGSRAAARNRDRPDKEPERNEPVRPGSKGDGDKPKDTPTKGYFVFFMPKFQWWGGGGYIQM